MKNKKANILTENIIFLIITFLFISALFIFINRASSKIGLIEEVQAKKIALIIDSAKPGTNILLNINDVLEKKSETIEDKNVVRIQGNIVMVKLSDKSGYSYAFFNDIDIKAELEPTKEGFLKIIIKEKQMEES